MKLLFFSLFFTVTVVYGSSSYSVALVDMGMDYTERGEGGIFLDSEKSKNILGSELRYDFSTSCVQGICANLGIRFLGMSGNSDYKGSYLQNNQSVNSRSSNTIYDLSADYTLIQPVSSFEFLYGLGFGYHFWYRELSSIQNEIYSWFYVTPIIGINVNLTNNFKIGMRFKYKYGINPTMQANSIDDTFRLGGENSLECIIPLRYSINKKIDIFTDFVFSKQSIERSNYILNKAYDAPLYEPASTDYQQYVKIGMTINY